MTQNEALYKPFREIQAAARNVAKISHECKVITDQEEYVAKFKHELMEVVYAWTQGESFGGIW